MSTKYKVTSESVWLQVFLLIKNKFDSLSKVANSGSYRDLTDAPSVGSVQISADGVTAVNIPSTITSMSKLLVYHNGLLLAQDINYTLNTENSSIALNGYTANSNDIFTFISL